MHPPQWSEHWFHEEELLCAAPQSCPAHSLLKKLWWQMKHLLADSTLSSTGNVYFHLEPLETDGERPEKHDKWKVRQWRYAENNENWDDAAITRRTLATGGCQRSCGQCSMLLYAFSRGHSWLWWGIWPCSPNGCSLSSPNTRKWNFTGDGQPPEKFWSPSWKLWSHSWKV